MQLQTKRSRKARPKKIALPVDVKEEVRKHKFYGQDQAQIVIDYLNQTGIDIVNPVVQLIEDTQQFKAGQLEKGFDIVRRINDVTRDLKLGVTESHAFSTLDGFTSKEVPTGDPKDAPLSFAFTRAVWLHKQDLLDRIRHCQKPDCNQWFFAVLPQQAFHSDACRLETMAKDPKFKERRKKYMRQLREEKKGGKS